MAHRVDSDGYITVSGKRRFVDQSLPTYQGTVDGSYWANMVQEEIANVIEYCGLTLEASGSADEAAGWVQLKEAIFLSGKIANAALASDISLSKISQGSLSYSTAGYTVSMAPDIGLTFLSPSSTATINIDNGGIFFSPSTSPGTELVNMRWATYDISTQLAAATKSDAETYIADSHQHRIGDTFVLAAIYDLGIPDTTALYGCMLHNNYSGVSGLSPNCHVEIEDTVGNNWGVTRITVRHTGSDAQLNLSEPIYLTVFFDADYLV